MFVERKNGTNLDEQEACKEEAISQEAVDYFQTIQTLQVPIVSK